MGEPDDKVTIVTDEYFDFLLTEVERPAREPNAKMTEMLRATRGMVEHRD